MGTKIVDKVIKYQGCPNDKTIAITTKKGYRYWYIFPEPIKMDIFDK